MPKVCIGIHVHSEPEQLSATLASARTCTDEGVDCMLLPDGPDAPTAAALARLRREAPWLVQIGTETPRGAPACFNRLAAWSDADVIVLLESGAQVGPRWLHHLLAALSADPRNGLAGPSTNRSWNEQAVFTACPDSPGAIARAAREAESLFGAEIRVLEPLHSLADFCYAVRRDVIQAIGGADEGYGLGPCWEMDYNIRAARSGFRGVWSCASYVHRAPFTARRLAEERQLFDANKSRYQDKFCGLRLRGQRADYEPHCKGDECEHFAPPSLIQLAIPLPADEAAIGPRANGVASEASALVTQSDGAHRKPSAVDSQRAGTGAPGPPQLDQSWPLASCIMVTRDRPDFVRQSVSYFARQDYPARELIIIDDGIESVEPSLPAALDVPGIRYVRLNEQQSIGSKRNLGCQLARGSIICHWDDDDWFAPPRLRVQLAPLLSGLADITGLQSEVFFDLDRWQFWRCAPELHRRLFVEDVHGGTLAYHKWVWETMARYPDASLAEDAGFLFGAVARGARLSRLDGQDIFIYLRHSANSWRFDCGEFVDARGWHEVPEPEILGDDRAFYLSRSTQGCRLPEGGCQSLLGNCDGDALIQAECETAEVREWPLISCIMPTADRRRFAQQAIARYRQQDYPYSELIILDDGEDPIGDLVPDDPRIRYQRLASRLNLGAKRNLACEHARGELVAHWDDDDWTAPWRLRYQVSRLIDAGADLCGLSNVFFWDPSRDQAWRYVYPSGQQFWVAGGTLCYRKSLWRQNPFPNINVAEDTRFVWDSKSPRMIALDDPRFYVAINHPRNTSPRQVGDPRYQPVPASEVKSLMADDWQFYVGLCRNL